MVVVDVVNWLNENLVVVDVVQTYPILLASESSKIFTLVQIYIESCKVQYSDVCMWKTIKTTSRYMYIQ